MERLPAARLRKTFQYPTDNDSDDDLPEALDEEEQEALIAKLSTANNALDTQYTTLFLPLPALASLLYLRSLFNSGTTLLSVLAITSLAVSAWTLYALPSSATGLAFIDGVDKNAAKAGSRDGGAAMKGPLELYLPLLNVALVVLLALGGWLLAEGTAWPGFGLLPGVVYVFTVGAKVVMGSVDMEELERLKYGYKGA